MAPEHMVPEDMAAEYRRDPISDRWVIIAPQRARRPDQLREPAPAEQTRDSCPFCRGHESATPPPSACYPSYEDWQVRVVPNLFPAVCAAEAAPAEDEGPYLRAEGVHEVIIESPEHVSSLSQLSDEQLHWTFVAYRDRLAALSQNPRLSYGLLFKNTRAAGGASLEHIHSQLIATTQVPREVLVEARQAAVYWQQRQGCLFCDVLADARRSSRLIAEREGVIAFCPYASRFPYETWILPTAHEARFSETSAATLDATSWLVRDVIRRLETRIDQAAYNFWIHTAPWKDADQAAFHWHIEIAPRLTRLAGFELGAGYFINPVRPEQAAQLLR